MDQLMLFNLPALKARKGVKTTQERWLPITEYQGARFDGSYEISNWGNVRNAKTQKLLSPFNCKGYLRIKLYDSLGIRRHIKIHRLVAYSFIGFPIQGKTEVNHIDGNPKNNSFTNLEWVTPAENKFKLRMARII